jgi:hypothetical protein
MAQSIQVLVVSLLVLAEGAFSQRPPPGRTAEIQEFIERLATEKALEVGSLAKGVSVGTLNDEASARVFWWSVAVNRWKKERNSGAGPLLAEGVLLDCVGRMIGVRTPVLSGERPTPFFFDLAESRPARSVEALEGALKIDPSLAEARFRSLRLRAAVDDPALQGLEEMARGPSSSLLTYLAAIARAEVAVAASDHPTASVWYQRAKDVHPTSVAAAIGLASLNPTIDVDLAELDSNDPYYLYPCRILTKSVDEALTARIGEVAK